ncbi:hypothetical protein TNCV_3196131 [Trichonephila clavipes]|nr:hypothetical protein TNCV_3196131 [Trichonephila clavipes]
MTSSDSLEAIELRVWKRNIGYRVSFLYNPPRNKPDLNSLLHNWNKHSFILGDFNAHSTRWGYVQNCPVGNLVEDFIDTNEINFIENSMASPTFLSYRGASSHPYLLLAHPDLTPFVYHHLIQAPGGVGHKILPVNISNPGETHAPRVTRWNLKKANWEKYASLTITLLGNCLLDLNNDKALDKIITTILACENVCIPKGHIINGKPFWNDKLQTLKEEKDLARGRADSSGLLKDCIYLRKKQAILKKEILNAKRASFNSFLENFYYRKDGPKAFRFISALNGKQMQPCKQLMKVGGKILTSDLDIAKIFLKYYRKVRNFRPRTQIRKREINSPRVNQKWDRLFSAPFSDEEFKEPFKNYLEGKALVLTAGFRRSYNTTEQIVRLTQHIKDGFQKKQSTLVVFVDFKSAFDRVWRKMLLKKLLHMNVSGHLFKWISDILSQRFLNIKYGNSRSGYGQTPQGSVLSPVLFNIMINDLLSFIDNAVPEINSLLNADDLVLWSTGSDIPKLESTLDSALVTLANWSLENETLRTDCATYLGISLYSRLTWTKHIAKVVENATSRLSLLKRIAGVKWGSSHSVL